MISGHPRSAALQGAPEQLQLASELVGDDGPDNPWRKGHARRGVIEVPGQDVSMDMRHAVAEDVVVHVTRPERLIQGPRHSVHVAPEPRRLLLGELGEVGDVAKVESNGRVAGQWPALLKVAVGELIPSSAPAWILSRPSSAGLWPDGRSSVPAFGSDRPSQ